MLFSKESVNTGRQEELDLFKAVAILFMILTHVMETVFSCLAEDFAFCALNHGWKMVILISNMLMAFGFMVCMGASIPFARHTHPESMMKRGGQLLLLSLLLNLLRAVPSGILFHQAEGITFTDSMLGSIFENDILFFAGYFFLFLGLLKKRGISLPGIYGLSFLLFFLSLFLQFGGESPALHILLGHFIITEESYFPFFNWLPVPLFGLAWGITLQHCKNKNDLYKWLGAGSLFAVLGIAAFLTVQGCFFDAKLDEFIKSAVFYTQTPGILLCNLLGIGFLLSFFFWIMKIFTWKWFHNTVHFLSKNLTAIYVFQWLLIPWAACILPRPTEPVPPSNALFIAIVILATSSLMAVGYNHLRSLHKPALN